MASGTTLFQTVVTATPPSGLPIMADSVNDTDHGVGTVQYIKIMDGRTAGTIKAAVTSNGLEVDVKNVQGTVQGLGSFQMVGTAQVLGSIQSVGTNQALGTFQPLAGSVHLASTGTLPLGTVQVLGSVQGVGTFQVLGSVQGVGTFQVLGSVQTVGTSQVLGSVQPVGTTQVLGTHQSAGTTLTKELRSGINFGTRIAGTIGNLIILAANPNRLGAMFYLESGSALYLKLGSSAGTFDYTLQLGTGGYYETPYNYTGTISGIWQFANGTVQITEVS
jgi:hypothetical protein